MLSQEGTGPVWGVTIEAVNLGYARVSMVLTPQMLNGLKVAHGGMIFALADTAFAYACNSANAASMSFTMAVTFLAAGRAGECITAQAIARHQAARTGVYDVAVYGADGRTLAALQGVSRTAGGKTKPDED